MIGCLDVHYFDENARAAAVVCESWTSSHVVAEYIATIPEIAEYQPGEFYRRELNPLLAVIAKIEQPISVYVIDGYCHLSGDRSPGLGDYLHRALGSDVVIVGVAKNRYRDTTHAAELLRGTSHRPLFVTAIGLGHAAAAQHIASMAGKHRLPWMLNAADQLARSGRTSLPRSRQP